MDEQKEVNTFIFFLNDGVSILQTGLNPCLISMFSGTGADQLAMSFSLSLQIKPETHSPATRDP